jgi:hypothetical protein
VNRGSSVNIVTVYGLNVRGYIKIKGLVRMLVDRGSISDRESNIRSRHRIRRYLGGIKPPIRWVPGALSLVSEADYSLIMTFQNAWSYTSTVPPFQRDSSVSCKDQFDLYAAIPCTTVSNCRGFMLNYLPVPSASLTWNLGDPNCIGRIRCVTEINISIIQLST